MTGARATCSYENLVSGACGVTCEVGTNDFYLDCEGPSGLPLRCSCLVNGHFLVDFWGTGVGFYASDCRDAGTRAANGMCVSGLDCCIEYFDGQKDGCGCGSKPPIASAPNCEAAAQAVGGKVVPICPQYTDGYGGGCWPPGTCP